MRERENSIGEAECYSSLLLSAMLISHCHPGGPSSQYSIIYSSSPCCITPPNTSAHRSIFRFNLLLKCSLLALDRVVECSMGMIRLTPSSIIVIPSLCARVYICFRFTPIQSHSTVHHSDDAAGGGSYTVPSSMSSSLLLFSVALLPPCLTHDRLVLVVVVVVMFLNRNLL